MNIMKSAVIIAVLIVVLGVVIMFIVAPQQVLDDILPTSQQEERVAPNEFEDTVVDPESGEAIKVPRTGGGSDGGGGGGSSSGSSGSSGCYLDSSAFALFNKGTEEFCIEQSGDVCTRKFVTCSLSVQNLDSVQSGGFNLNAKVFEQGTGAPTIDEETLSSQLGPGDIVDLEQLFDISGPEADLDLTCFFQIAEVPSEEVCA